MVTRPVRLDYNLYVGRKPVNKKQTARKQPPGRHTKNSLPCSTESRLHVGICKLTLHLPEVASLKEKRQVARSLADRIRNRFNVAVAEVEDADLRQRLTLGLCCVSNDRGHTDAMLSGVLNYIEESRRDVELLEVQSEIISGV